MTDTQALTIHNFVPSTTPVLAGALVGLKGSIEAAAQAQLDALLEVDDSYTETEMMAMLKVEQLRQVNGVDLAAVLLRAEYINEIEANNLISRHPEGYSNLQEMAKAQGISSSELSQTLDLVNIVFPYVQEYLGLAIPILWEEVGKSNMRELVPVLKSIITGEEAGAQSVREATERILDDVAATYIAAGRDEEAQDEIVVRRAAIEQLIQDGQHLTNRELRTRIRPERTPSIEVATITDRENNVTIVAECTPEQWELFMRRMGAYADPMPFLAPEDAAQRQREALQIRPIRNLMDYVGGANA
jgi:hypothetical protein